MKGENRGLLSYGAFPNSEGKRESAPNFKSLVQKSWCHRLDGSTKKCFDLKKQYSFDVTEKWEYKNAQREREHF